ncbi:MAG: FN3 associated domain-containing protein [Christensenellales bacterium]
MICSHCQKESAPLSRVCPYCGQYMGEEPAMVKGDSVPLYDSSDYNPPAGRAAYGNPVRPRAAGKRGRPRKRRVSSRQGRDAYRRHRVNWALVGLAVLVLGFLSAVGGYIFLNVTPQGQLILARAGRGASADAYWTLGTEYLDQGYIARAVAAYEKALAIQPEHPELVSKLMLLGEAYEAAGEAPKAEALYTRIYSQLAPADPIGYRNTIRLMLQGERVLAASNLMREAFEKTGDESFFSQRAAMVPLPPTASQSSGRHLKSLKVEFQSPQGYDIYYTTGAAALPEEGTLYTGPIMIGEGTHEFRAVCVSSVLISDEMSVRYIIALPTPPAPKTNLQPDSYKAGRTVRLRDMETDKSDPLKKNTLYFTLDGRPASIDSPRYTGEPIALPSGRVTLRAIAVNGYGKVSNELNISYDIAGPFKKYFNETDEFQGLTLMKTDYEAFVALHGEPQSSQPVEDDLVSGSCLSAQYAWGEARFVSTDKGRLLYYLDSNDPALTGPRATRIGMEMEEVIGKFRDMRQPPNDQGNRGLYYDIAAGYGGYSVASDDPTTGTLGYVATIFQETSTTRMLDYSIRSGRVSRIVLAYYDHKISNVH